MSIGLFVKFSTVWHKVKIMSYSTRIEITTEIDLLTTASCEYATVIVLIEYYKYGHPVGIELITH